MKYLKYLVGFTVGLWFIWCFIINVILPIVPSRQWCGFVLLAPFIAFILWSYFVLDRYSDDHSDEDEERYL